MAHSHAGHDHAGHGHTHPHGDERRLFWALLLTGGFMVAEIAGGILSGSLALIADAGHMLTDTAALALAWFAARMARLPANPRRSYGYHRVQILAAFINGATLIGVAAWILIEAVQRFLEPVEVLGGIMLTVAAVGLIVNIAAFFILKAGDSGNLNIRGAVLHVMGDLLGSMATMVAAGVILLTGWMPIDPILSVVVSLLIVRGAWDLTKRSWHLLMEGVPEGFDLEELKRELPLAASGVLDIHHVHLWALTPERPLITLHARIAEDADHDTVLRRLQVILAERFALSHATIQIERGTCTEGRGASHKAGHRHSPSDHARP